MIKTIEATDNETVQQFEDIIDSVFKIMDEVKTESWEQNRMDRYFKIEDLIERLQRTIDDMTIEYDDD